MWTQGRGHILTVSLALDSQVASMAGNVGFQLNGIKLFYKRDWTAQQSKALLHWGPQQLRQGDGNGGRCR
jgi:hypothetical protein